MNRAASAWRVLLVAVLAGTHVRGGADEPAWPRFRGPDGSGVIAFEGLPERWSATENVRWKTDLPGRGWASPIICDNSLFLTTVVSSAEYEEPLKGLYFGGERRQPLPDEHQWLVYAIDATDGSVQWQRVAHRGAPPLGIHIKNSRASETPVTDGRRLYVYFGNVGIFCYDLAGTLIWSKPIAPVETRFSWGPAASPVLHEGRLYVVNDNEEQSYLLALDAATGETVWRVDRDEKSNWSTPFVWQNELRTEIVVPGTGRTRGYDLDGNLLYELAGASAITIATPYTAHGLLYVSSGYVMDPRKPIFAIRPGAVGNISLSGEETSNQFIAWCQKSAAPYNPTTLVYGDRLYVLLDRGFLACYHAVTGEPIYPVQRIAQGRAFTSSPWAYQGKVFCLNEYGQTFVVPAGDEFSISHINSLADDDMCMATPAVAGNRLYIRSSERVYCIEESGATVTDQRPAP